MSTTVRVSRRDLTATVLGLAAILSLGCDDSTGPTTGAIRVAVSTSGANSDVDPDGYTVSIDGGPTQTIGLNTAVTIANLPPGNHLVRLDGLALNCSIAGTNPLSVDVITGGKASSPVSVSFSVSCVAKTGNIQIVTETSGPDADSDGYSVFVLPAGRVELPANGSRTITGIRVGQWALGLSGVSGNCTVDEPNPRTVSVALGATVDVAFAIRCFTAGALGVTTATSGVEIDPDGYQVVLRHQRASASTSANAPANGTVTVSRLLPGNYVLTLFGVVPNCDPVIPSPRAVDISPGSVTAVTIDVTCTAPIQLAYVKGTGANAEIHAVNSNGTGANRLTDQQRADVNPAWSPEGGRIAFASDRDGNREIYVMNANGQNPVRLTSNPTADYRPAWSPDGTRIAFVTERDGNAEIYVMNADGTNPSRLTVHAADDSEPAWSPDGSRIAFSSDRDGIRRIWVMNADGSGVVRLTSSSLGESQPAWSPDGARIAFSGESSSRAATDIFTVNADGSERIQLTRDFDSAMDPAWSPDGRKIAFTATNVCSGFYDYDCFSNIRVVGTDGILYSATFGEQTSEPAWRP